MKFPWPWTDFGRPNALSSMNHPPQLEALENRTRIPSRVVQVDTNLFPNVIDPILCQDIPNRNPWRMNINVFKGEILERIFSQSVVIFQVDKSCEMLTKGPYL